ncbi:MAG: germination protein YpeB [Oscillospiraceae bacterium]|nr:germination protein YpeB [Oscillospiraceae bacterium]
MKKRSTIRLTSFICAAFMVMGGFIFSKELQLLRYEREITNSHRHAFSELVTGVREVSNSLEKSLYATSPSMVSAVCTDVFGKAMIAQAAMSRLPFSNLELDKTSGVMAKIGDYAFLLSKGGAYTQEQYENLEALSQAASRLSEELESLLTDVDRGVLSIAQLRGADVDVPQLSDSISSIESEFPELPHLIYDGPFSEHITQIEPVFLSGMDEVTEDTARKNAANALGTAPENLTATGESAGNLPVYGFSCRINGGDKYIQVTKSGGVVLSIMSSREISRENISLPDALKISGRYLQNMGFEDMTQSYYMTQGGVLTANYAFTKDVVICYTDLIKVSVALDNGEITGFESLGYVMSHTLRDIPEPQVDADTAMEMVSPELTVLSHELSVIPTDGKYEKFCHEFKCENSDGRHYIVYVNAITGEQEKILILLEDESGTLTI